MFYILRLIDTIVLSLSYIVYRNKVRLEEKVEKRLQEYMIKSVKLLKRSAIYKLTLQEVFQYQ